MTIFTAISFIIGALFGGGVVFWRAKRTQSTSAFSADSDESEELREKASKAVQTRIEKRKTRIVEAAQKDGKITNDGVEDMFCISDRTASNYLQQLTKAKILTKVGLSGRGVYYVPTETT